MNRFTLPLFLTVSTGVLALGLLAQADPPKKPGLPNNWIDVSAAEVRSAGDPYAVLGGDTSYDPKQLTMAFRKLAAKFNNDLNSGDPAKAAAATEAIKKLNAAKSFLLNPEIENHRRGAWYYNDGSTDGPKARSADSSANARQNTGSARNETTGRTGTQQTRWDNYFAKMKTARGPEERKALREMIVGQVETAKDFRAVITASAQPKDPAWQAEITDFTKKNMNVFMETKPSLTDINSLAQITGSPAGAAVVYDAALSSAKTPAEMYNALRPTGSDSTTGRGWPPELKASVEKNLYRFYRMNPSADQRTQMEALIKVSNNSGVGQGYIERATAKANFVNKGNTAEAFKPGMGSMFKGMMGKVMGKMLAVDPTIVTSAVRGYVEDGEAKALATKTCPVGATHTPRLISPGFIQLLSMSSVQDQDAIFKSCTDVSIATGAALKADLATTLGENRDRLKIDEKSMKCDAKQISYQSDSGLSTLIKFDDQGDVATIDVRPTGGKGNPNQWVTYRAKEPTETIEYSSFDYPKDKVVDSPAKVAEGETAFFLRLTCQRSTCDEAAFRKATSYQSETNFFSIKDMSQVSQPGVQAPFGDMELPFLEKGGYDLHRLIGLSRSLGREVPLAPKLCQELKASGAKQLELAVKKETQPGAASEDGFH